MKSLIIMAALIAGYLGLNRFTLTQGAIERMVQFQYQPTPEAVEKRCETIRPNSQVKVSQTLIGMEGGSVISQQNKGVVVNSADKLCDYWKKYVPQKHDSFILHPNKIKVDIVEKIPFNTANVDLETTITYWYIEMVTNPNTGKKQQAIRNVSIQREEKMVLKRGFMGSYQIVSLDGKDTIKQPENANKGRKTF